MWLGWLSWARVLMIPDEARYAGVAREMLRSGSHAVPLLDGMPYFQKPPLYYWLTEICFSVFGLHEWAAHAPSWFIAWMSVCGLYAFLRRYRNAKTATIAVIILSTTPFFYGVAQFSNTDMLVAGFISLTLLASVHAVLLAERAQPYRGTSLAAAALAGCAVLSKGFIGFVLPGLTICLWLLFTRRWRGFSVLLWPPLLYYYLLLLLFLGFG